MNLAGGRIMLKYSVAEEECPNGEMDGQTINVTRFSNEVVAEVFLFIKKLLHVASRLKVVPLTG